MHHSDFLTVLAAIYHPKAYLELGVHMGETFQKMQMCCPRCVGVNRDPGLEDSGILRMDTQEFFAQNKETFDLIFIDADHSFEAVRADFYGAMDILNPGGLLVLHDTDPENDALMADGYCGDSYRIVTEFLFREANSYAFITLPLNEAGITLVQRRFDTRVGLRSP